MSNAMDPPSLDDGGQATNSQATNGQASNGHTANGQAANGLGQRVAGLSPEKQALLERRLMERRALKEPPAIRPREHNGTAPLSGAQELMWLLHQLTPDTHAYNSSGARRLHGELDFDALQRALGTVIQRHESLRTTFELRGEEPVQILNATVPVVLALIEAPGIEEQELTELLREQVRRPFDLSTPPLLRATLIRIAPDDHVLLTSANHIVWDGWSKGIFFRELAECYDAYLSGREPQLEDLPIQYADFAAWQREWLQNDRLEGQLAYWREHLREAPPLLELPTDHPRPAVSSQRGDRLELWVPEQTLSALEQLSQQQGVTLFMTLVSAWVVFLHRFSQQEDIVVGTPIAGRNRVEVEGLIGYFNNTLALRVSCAGDPRFTELLGRVRDTALGAYANQDVSFEQVVRDLAPQRDLSHSPLFQSLIVLQNAASEKLELRGLSMEMIVTESGTAKFDLSLGMGQYEGSLHASFEYNTDLFDRETVEGVRAQFSTLLEEVVADPARPISDFALLTPAEELELVRESRGPQAPIPDASLGTLVAERASSTPSQIAIVDGALELSYAQLHSRSEALACALRQRGVRAGDFVGLHMDRCSGLIISLLAILQTGATCVPLDTAYPIERLRFMVSDANVKLVVTKAGLREDAEGLGVALLVVDRADAQIVEGAAGAHLAEDEQARVDPRSVAFAMYTSGSTGQPKGVLLEHRGLVNHTLASIRRFDLQPHDRVLQFASISFDLSLEEIFCTLLAGATLVVRDAEMPLGGRGLIEWLERMQVTVMDLPTAFWHEWVGDLDELALQPPQALRLVIVGGEKASAAVLARWRRLAGAEVRWINTYGPTEASVVASTYEPPVDWAYEPGHELPIGWPLENVDLYVLDRRGRPVAHGVRGELHIGGAGVARDYLGHSADAPERFPVFELADGERVYRTGDIVRRRGDGALEFHGRVDEQIKLRGYRIDPGEIEVLLEQHDRVEQALVMVRENAQGQPLLVAYALVEGPSEPQLGATLRRFLSERLAAFALPTSVIPVDELPLTSSGKVDRDALPAPPTAIKTPARDEVELELAGIWSELLGHEPGVTESFFELGGHSMLAVRMFALIEQRLGVRLSLTKLIGAPTIAALADEVREERTEQRPWEVLVPLKPSGTRVPLFLIHVVRGEVLCYRDLVRHLDLDQPAYGVEAIGRDGRVAPLTRFEDMARRYIDEVRTVQPHGPYLLAGWCIGGNLAYQMAHHLEQEGERVAFVGLIDSHPLGLGLRRKVSFIARINSHLRDLGTLERDERLPFLQKSATNAWLRIRYSLWWQISKHLYLNRGRSLPAALNDPEALNKVAASENSTPSYGGKVTLFPAVPINRESASDERVHWGELARGGMDVRNIDSDGVEHKSLLSEPHVAVVAGELEAAIHEALASEGE